MRSRVDWRGRRNISYKFMETSLRRVCDDAESQRGVDCTGCEISYQLERETKHFLLKYENFSLIDAF